MDKEISDIQESSKLFRMDIDLLEDRMMDVEMSASGVSGTIAPFTHFSLFFPLFRSLTHIPLSRPVTSLFILIFHPLPHACTRDIQPARRVSLFSFIL